MPQFAVGDRDVLFVGNRNAVSPLVAFMHGRFRIASDATGVETVRFHDGSPVPVTGAPGRQSAAPRSDSRSLSLPEFRAAISARLSAQRGRAR
jgi:hypothetical protein